MASLARIAGSKLSFLQFSLRVTQSQKSFNFACEHARPFAFKRKPTAPSDRKPKVEETNEEPDKVPNENIKDDRPSYKERRRLRLQEKAAQTNPMSFDDLTKNMDGKSEIPVAKQEIDSRPVPPEEQPIRTFRERENTNFPPPHRPRQNRVDNEGEEPQRKPKSANLRIEFKLPEKKIVKENPKQEIPQSESISPQKELPVIQNDAHVQTEPISPPINLKEQLKPVISSPKELKEPPSGSTTKQAKEIPPIALGKCPGCGVPLQVDRPTELGYFVPHYERRSTKNKPPPWYVSKNSYLSLFSQEEILASIAEARDKTKIWELSKRLEDKKEALKELDSMKHPILQAEEQKEMMEKAAASEISPNTEAVSSEKNETKPIVNIPTVTDGTKPEGEDDFDADLEAPPTIDIDSMKDITEEQKRILKEEIEKLQLEIEKELPPVTDFLTAQDAMDMEKAEKRQHQQEICYRCFQLKNYGKVVPVSIPMSQFREKLSQLANRKMLVFKVVDIFDFDGSFLPDFREIIGNNPVVLIANKSDLLPRGVSYERVTTWLRRAAKEKGLLVENCFLVSSLWRRGMMQIIDKYLESARAK